MGGGVYLFIYLFIYLFYRHKWSKESRIDRGSSIDRTHAHARARTHTQLKSHIHRADGMRRDKISEMCVYTCTHKNRYTHIHPHTHDEN